MDYSAGIDHMNQVLSFDRLVYFGHICEESGLMSQKEESKAVLKPKVGFGKRQMEHKEVRQMKDELVRNYSVSPHKIRKAGVEEM